MRIVINTHQVSIRLVGTVLAVPGAMMLAIALARRSLPLTAASAAALALTWWLRGSASCLVRRRADSALDQAAQTLTLMGARHERREGSVTVLRTGTEIRARPLGPYAILSFRFAEEGARRERYVRDTIVKFQRYRQ